MSISVFEYWPFDLVNTTITRMFSYTDPTGVVPPFKSAFYFEPTLRQLVCLDEDDAGNWLSSWNMVYKPGQGVAEVSDWYPQKNSVLSALWGPVQKNNLSSPILWGNVVNIGDVIKSTPRYDAWSSTPPWCCHGSGFQAVHFEDLLPDFVLGDDIVHDVLQFQYSQTWNGKTTGARYYMAKGIGPIAIEWIAFDKSGNITKTEPRCYAVVTNKTWPVDNQ